MKKYSVTVNYHGIDIEVEGTYTPGSKDYFDKDFGNWLPGDPFEIDEIIITSITGEFTLDGLPEYSELEQLIEEQIKQEGE